MVGSGQLGQGLNGLINTTYFLPVTAVINGVNQPLTGIDEVWFSGSLLGTTSGTGNVVAKQSSGTGFWTWGQNLVGQCGVNPSLVTTLGYVLTAPTFFTVTGNVSSLKTNTTLLCSISTTTSYLAGNGILYAAGFNAVNYPGWIPNTPSNQNVLTVGFSGVKAAIPWSDPIKDWQNINISPGMHGGMLILTQYGKVYGLGVDDSSIINGQVKGSAVLLV